MQMRAASHSDSARLSPAVVHGAGILRDTATAEFLLPQDIDPTRSRLTLNLGTSPLAIIRGIQRDMHVYPYYCTEQVVSIATPILALLRAERTAPGIASGRGRTDIERAVAMISDSIAPMRIGTGPRRLDDAMAQCYAGHKSARRSRGRLRYSGVRRPSRRRTCARRCVYASEAIPFAKWYDAARRGWRSGGGGGSDRLLGTPDIGAENELVRMAPQITRETDPPRTILQNRLSTWAALELLAAAWAEVRVEVRRAVLQPAPEQFYFQSRVGMKRGC